MLRLIYIKIYKKLGFLDRQISSYLHLLHKLKPNVLLFKFRSLKLSRCPTNFSSNYITGSQSAIRYSFSKPNISHLCTDQQSISVLHVN